MKQAVKGKSIIHMKNDLLRIISCLLILISVLSGCGGTPAPSVTQTSTSTEIANEVSVSPTTSVAPDECSPEQIETEVQNVQRHMREFDDASTLASSMPRNQLSEPIANLQRIRREAEDEVTSPCLNELRKYQIDHMNSVINTLLAFMRATDPLAIDCVEIQSNTEEEAICQTIVLARQQHDQYVLELARLLGITPVAATGAPEASPSETPSP
jgi:hypothetical protein